MAVRPLVNLERLTTAHVNSVDGSMTYESGIAYSANTTVSYNGSLYTANVEIEDSDTDTPDIAPDKWSLTINAPETGTSGDISALAARVTALEGTVGDNDSGLVKDVDDLQDDVDAIFDNIDKNGVKNYVALNYSPARAIYNSATVNSATENEVSLTSGVNYARYSIFYGLENIPAGNYILSFNAESSDADFTPVMTVYVDDVIIGNVLRPDIEHEITIPANAQLIDFRFFASLASDTEVRTVKFKNFMVRDANNPDNTYAPYAMSNRELTEVAKSVEPHMQVATITDNTKFDGTIVCVKSGRIVSIASDIVIKNGASFITNEEVASDMILPVPSAQMASAVFAGTLTVGNNPVVVKVTDDGKLVMTAFTNSSNAAIYGRITMAYISKE